MTKTATAEKIEPLDSRIAMILNSGDHHPSETLAALIRETDEAIDHSDQASREARAIAADPKIIDGGAIGRAHDAEHAAYRLRNGMAALQELHRESVLREQIKAWNLRADAVEAKRDALSAELAERYPLLSSWFAKIAADIKACDREIDEINRSAIGHEGRRLVDVELHARGLAGWMANDVRLVEKVKLPELVIGRHGTVDAWPPQQQSFGLSIMSAFPRNGSVSLAKEMMSTRVIGHKKVGNQLVAIYDDGTEDSIDMGPVQSSVPISDLREQIAAEQQARVEDSAKLARDAEQREAGRIAHNSAEAERASAFEKEQRRLRAGRLPDADAR